MANNKYKVLIVEDDLNIQNLLKMILRTNDYHVLSALNFASAKTLWLSYLADVIILDLRLPDKDGLEFIKYIRKDSIVTIIVLSARTNESDIVCALDCGANDYITKPFRVEELLARIRATLRNTRRNSENGVILGNYFQ